MVRFLSILMLIVLAAGTHAQNGDPRAGRAKSLTCAACHGNNGISPNPLWPNLAGQKEDYLVKALRDFREGRRQDPTMSPQAQTLSNVDIADLAAYYSGLR